MDTPVSSGIFDLDYIFGQRQKSCVEYCAEKNVSMEIRENALKEKRQRIVEVSSLFHSASEELNIFTYGLG